MQKNEKNEQKYYFTVSKADFKNKSDFISNVGRVQKDLNGIDHDSRLMTVDEIAKSMTTKVFRPFYYQGDRPNGSHFKGFKANMIAVDYDGRFTNGKELYSHNDQGNVIRAMQKDLSIIQPSSNATPNDFRFHGLILLDDVVESEDVYRQLYLEVVNELSMKYGVKLDSLPVTQLMSPSNHRPKIIGKTFDVREKLFVIHQNVVNKQQRLLRKPQLSKNLTVADLVKNDVIQSIDLNLKSKAANKQLSINQKQLLHVAEAIAAEDYETRRDFVWALRFLVEKRLLKLEEAYQIIEPIEAAHHKKHSFYIDLMEHRGPSKISISKLKRIIEDVGFDVRDVFGKKVIQPSVFDKEIEFKGYISESDKAMKVFTKLMKNHKNNLLVAPTGSGKTYAATQLIDKLAKNGELDHVVYATPRINLVENLRQDFTMICGKTTYGSDLRKKFHMQDHIVLTTIDTAANIMEQILKRQAKVGFSDDDFSLNQKKRIKEAKFQMSDDATIEEIEQSVKRYGRLNLFTEQKKLNDYINHAIFNQKKDGKNLLVVDEVHMLIQDSVFKPETIEKFRRLENEWVANGNTVLNITATPQNLYLSHFQLKIKFAQKDRQKLFDHAYKYELFEKKADDATEKFLNELVKKSNSKPQAHFLVYIENRAIIDEVVNRLNDEFNIPAIHIWSQAMDSRKLEEQQLIKGHENQKIRIFVATSTLSAGLSIKNQKDDEVWILATKDSANWLPSLIIQMANRFRNHYSDFVIFANGNKNQSSLKFDFNSNVDFNVRLAINAAIAWNAYRSGQDYSRVKQQRPVDEFKLDAIERSSNLMLDKNHLLIPNEDRIVASVIKLYVKRIPKTLKLWFLDLEKFLNVDFKNLSSVNTSVLENPAKPTKKEATQAILNDVYGCYYSLIRHQNIEICEQTLKSREKDDVYFVIKHAVSQILQEIKNPTAEQFDKRVREEINPIINEILDPSAKKARKYSNPVRVKEDAKIIKRIKQIDNYGIDSVLHQGLKMINRDIQLGKNRFTSRKELNHYYKSIAEKLLLDTKKGFSALHQVAVNPNVFEDFLIVKNSKSNGARIYRLMGIKDDQYFADQYTSTFAATLLESV